MMQHRSTFGEVTRFSPLVGGFDPRAVRQSALSFNGQDAGLSRQRHGFDSRWGRHLGKALRCVSSSVAEREDVALQARVRFSADTPEGCSDNGNGDA